MCSYSQLNSQIDKIDRAILFCLDTNSRIPTATIAQELRIPEATVRYRMQALFNSSVISSLYPVLGVGRVGLSVHKLMFKLQKADENEIALFVEYLSKDVLVNWVARFDGMYDIGCTLLVKSAGEVSLFLDRTRKRFHSNIRQIAYAVNIQAEFYARDYLVRKRRARGSIAATYTSFSDAPISIDTVDWQIVRTIAADVRATATEIAKKIHVSSETVGRRLRSLESKGVITGYRLHLDPVALGQTSYYLLLYLNVVSEERLAKLLNHLRTNPSVVYVIKMLGEWDYDVSIELPNATEYRNFMLELMNHFSEVIRDVHTLTTWNVAKFSILPRSNDITS